MHTHRDIFNSSKCDICLLPIELWNNRKRGRPAHRPIVNCKSCKKDFKRNQYNYKQEYCSMKCVITSNVAKSKYKDNYPTVFVGNHPNTMKSSKRMKLHRFLMVQEIGRPLKANEIVHHINGNKLDNRIENLQLMTHEEHSRLHSHTNGFKMCNVGRKRVSRLK